MKLSVIVPVYNVAPYLRECLDSLVAQTFAGWEAICVDDGSTDGSGAILDEYAARDSRFRVVHQQNRGVSAARNLAIEIAQGEWIGFLDADDSVAPDWFERMLGHAVDGVDIVHTDSRCGFGMGGRPVGDRTYRTFLRDGWSQLNLVRRAFASGERYPEGMRLKEDVIFFTKLALKANRIAWVEEGGYNYRSRTGSAIAMHVDENDSLRFFEEILRIGLPRKDAARAIGYDLVLWVKGRDWSGGYDSAKCGLLEFWREHVKSGELKAGDLRWWWRPGFRRWIRTGDIRLLKLTLRLRVLASGYWWSGR